MEPGRALVAQQRLMLLAMGLTTAASGLLLSLAEVAGPPRPLPVPTATMAVLLLLAELGRLRVEVRRSAVTVTLSDVAMVVALFTLPPAVAVVLRVLVCAPVVLWLYRRSRARLMVNVTVLLFESSVCAALLVHLPHTDPLSPRSWLAALVAVQLSGMLAGLTVNLAIVLHGDEQSTRQVLEGLLLGAVISAVTGMLGVMCVTVLSSTAQGGWLVLAGILLGILAYRQYAGLLERKAAVESVHAFTRVLEGHDDERRLAATVLREVPRLVGAASAEVLVVADDALRRVTVADDTLLLSAVSDLDSRLFDVVNLGEPRVLRSHDSRRTWRDVMAGRQLPERLAAPLPAETGASGVLVAVGRLGHARRFRKSDLLLFETLASHAGVALAKTQLLDRLRHDVDHDRLTGLLNRRGIEDALAASDTCGAAVALQLTGLREVNDALGHAAGDALLEAMARRVAADVRADSPVGRVDDDVLAVLLPGSGTDEARAVAERLLTVLAEPVEVAGVPVALGASIGIAVRGKSQDLLRRAEIALRTSSARGGIREFEAGMEPPSARRLGIAAELRQVLADPALGDQLVPFYQPKADLASGEVRAVEALVRWVHPTRGLVAPGDFIPVVESTDLVRPLTLHVLDRALTDATRWLRAGSPLSVAVNLSARNLHDPALVEDVAQLLRRHGVSPGLLTLEITESAVMEDPDRAQEVLAGLAGLGVALSVDDFGTGHSSLAYLARLPVSEVKVDRAFVRRMTSDRRDAAVVRSIVDLGHSLGLRVVAEGVEDDECWAALADAGVDVAQGFLLSRPLPPAALDVWLEHHRSRQTARVASA